MAIWVFTNTTKRFLLDLSGVEIEFYPGKILIPDLYSLNDREGRGGIWYDSGGDRWGEYWDRWAEKTIAQLWFPVIHCIHPLPTDDEFQIMANHLGKMLAR